MAEGNWMCDIRSARALCFWFTESFQLEKTNEKKAIDCSVKSHICYFLKLLCQQEFHNGQNFSCFKVFVDWAFSKILQPDQYNNYKLNRYNLAKDCSEIANSSQLNRHLTDQIQAI